ncbi:MAG: glutamine synthetase [Bacillota bacterium]|nr:glutamine synthetase [Bacillota bacterium]
MEERRWCSLELDKMLFTIPVEEHTAERVREILDGHPEVKFVSLVGLDIGGHDTDEKIPVGLFKKDMEQFFRQGVQTDGSSVVLPRIAVLNNARVDIIPDLSVNWYVDYNFDQLDMAPNAPVGTLRIPSYLVHNDIHTVGSRVILKNAIEAMDKGLRRLLAENPYVFDYLPFRSADEIEAVELTAATELEFWVKTPDDKADLEQLSASQTMKEQYWKRTIGPVRSALEMSLILLDKYGFEVEMGHKEVGGVKAKLGHSGEFDHVMEQLEIDWKYSLAMQAADNENQVKYVVKDVFRRYGLDVTFMAKPVEGVAGNGEHTHMGVAAKLKDGRRVNLFSPLDPERDYMSPIGFGALMGLLKNYEVAEAFIASTNDALNRLKPGFEAPVCVVASIGHSVDIPSRNRTVLAGLVRDKMNPLSTRFELRSPTPKNNTYLVLAVCYAAMLDGIRAALEAGKSPRELEQALSKEYGEEAFYLEKDRVYRSEKHIYDEYTQEERDRCFGKAPLTVWESIQALDRYPDKVQVLMEDGVFDETTLLSYKEAVIDQWVLELHSRIIPETMSLVRECRKLHEDHSCTDYDLMNWSRVQDLRVYLGQDKIEKKSLLTRIKMELNNGEYEKASALQLEMAEKARALVEGYIEYKKNLL